jgi:hypothetical protein
MRVSSLLIGVEQTLAGNAKSSSVLAAALKSESALAVTDTQRKIRELEADILQHRPMADQLNRDLIAYLGHDEIQVTPEKTGYQLMRS